MKYTFIKLAALSILTFSFAFSFGQSIVGWNTIGAANWTLKDGVIQADKGQGFLVTPKSYKDFSITLEFWPSTDAVSGVFLRCSDPKAVNKNSAYKVNINDKNAEYGTGSIAGITPAKKKVETANKWNTYEIIAKGNHITIKINNTLTVDTTNDLYKEGPIGLQQFDGLIKFRNIKIKAL